MNKDALAKKLRSQIRTIPNFPKEGILFEDITTMLNVKLFKDTINFLANHYKDSKIDLIAGLESRGFFFAAPLAYALGVGFVPIRKPKKLPFDTYSQKYSLEYGVDSLEIHTDALKCEEFNGSPKVLLVDDLIATGGSAHAAELLIKRAGGECVECCFIIEISALEGAKNLDSKSFSILEV